MGLEADMTDGGKIVGGDFQFLSYDCRTWKLLRFMIRIRRRIPFFLLLCVFLGGLEAVEFVGRWVWRGPEEQGPAWSYGFASNPPEPPSRFRFFISFFALSGVMRPLLTHSCSL